MLPVTTAERHVALDVLRGAALLGVLLVNLHSGFRVSLFQHILSFHTHAGRANHAMDILLAWVFEFKAFTLFSFLFGVGVGAQAERAVRHQLNAARFLARRFAILLVIGLCHMLLVWNGDILTLYGVCGLLLIPFVAISARRLAVLGLIVIALSPFLPFFNSLVPTETSMRAQAAIATRVYATGSFGEIQALRFSEAVHFIAPLLISSLPRTFGLMLVGIAVWHSGVLRQLAEQRKLLRGILIVGGSLGALTTTLQAWSKETSESPPEVFDWLDPYSVVLLAFAYAAGLLLWQSSGPPGTLDG